MSGGAVWAKSRARPWVAAVGAYLTITLGVPLSNGASEGPSFAAHAAWVLGTVFVISASALAVQRAWRRARRVIGGGARLPSPERPAHGLERGHPTARSR